MSRISILPRCAKVGQCPLYPRKRTRLITVVLSALCRSGHATFFGSNFKGRRH